MDFLLVREDQKNLLHIANILHISNPLSISNIFSQGCEQEVRIRDDTLSQCSATKGWSSEKNSQDQWKVTYKFLTSSLA